MATLFAAKMHSFFGGKSLPRWQPAAMVNIASVCLPAEDNSDIPRGRLRWLKAPAAVLNCIKFRSENKLRQI
jgi:hypothetical protein